MDNSLDPGDRRRDRNRGEISRLPASLRWTGESDCPSRGALSILLLLTRGDAPAHPCSIAGWEAKYWIEPNIELARNYGLNAQDLRPVEQLIEEHEEEIRDAWHDHFES
jgi:hypothetical protein